MGEESCFATIAGPAWSASPSPRRFQFHRAFHIREYGISTRIAAALTSDVRRLWANPVGHGRREHSVLTRIPWRIL